MLVITGVVEKVVVVLSSKLTNFDQGQLCVCEKGVIGNVAKNNFTTELKHKTVDKICCMYDCMYVCV